MPNAAPATDASPHPALPPGRPSAAAPAAAVVLDARALIATAIALAAPFALHAAASFFIPLLVSVFLSFTLSPLVARLERWRLPRALGAALALTLVVAATGLVVQLALNGAADVLDELPRAVQRLRVAVTSWERDGQGPLKQVSETAKELQKLAGATAAAAAAAPAPAGTAAPAPAAETKATFTAGMVTFVGQIVTVLFLTYFLLAAGDLFRRRLLQAHGPSLARRKRTLQILRQVHRVSQRYFALMLAGNVVIGAVTGIGLALLDLHHPVFWGVTMAVLHTIPYVGTVAAAGAIGLSGYQQFASAGHALAAAAVPVAAALAIGFWLHMALLVRAARMNAVVIFVALLFWGMVWGLWGLLLAFPIMATLKIVFSEVDRLRPLALLMSD